MSGMFENIKKGDSVLLTVPVRIPGSKSMMVWRVRQIERVYQNTFVVDTRKYYRGDGSNAGGRDAWNDHSKVRPVEGAGVRQSTVEEEVTLNRNIESLQMVKAVAEKLERRDNIKLVQNAAHCEFIRSAMLEINKLFQENA